MRARSNVLSGIVNGIDYDEYNPETDKRIPHNYNQVLSEKKSGRIKLHFRRNWDYRG